METNTFNIDSAKSDIAWIGRKVTGSHNGTIGIAEGALVLTDGQLTGGKISVDTTAIVILDVTDPATNAQFAGHLASDDFFASSQYPRATLDITSVSQPVGKNYHIAGDLTIKGITHPVEFDAEINQAADALQASAKVIVDRTLYGMKFRSGNFFKDLGDTLIYNDFTLNIRVTAGKAA